MVHHKQTGFAMKTTSSAALLTSKRLHFGGSKHFSRISRMCARYWSQPKWLKLSQRRIEKWLESWKIRTIEAWTVITAWARGSGIPAVRSCKKHCFLFFSEALSLPSMALNDCYFFSSCLKNTVDVWWCARPTLAPDLKVQIWATFTLAGVATRQRLAIAPGQSSRLELRNGDY